MGEEIDMAYSDRELLARLIECEAGGEGENGMKAVASVVMNRVRSTGGEYARVGQGSIRNIIFQPGQFVCASETERGSYNPQNIYNMRPTEIHYEIADWAIAGGEGENGMKAVASVVMNRVRSTGGEYARVGQGSIRNIIFQPGQFVCASATERGSYNPQNIYNMRPTDIHYEIADWAIAGNRLNGLGTALWFFNPFSPSCRANFPSNVGTFVMRIGDHCFYNPTAAYYDT